MSRNIRKHDTGPKHLSFDSVVFSMFTKEEIKKLCITKICTPLTLDPLGHPLSGGLYDKSLGPMTEKSEPCGTCRKNLYFCPGHFGYIELPLPVVNPIFYRMIGTILRMACLSCFRFQIPEHVKYSITLQIRLLNCGLVTEAVEIANSIALLILVHESLENIPEDVVLPIRKYETLAQEMQEKLNGEYVLTKNTETLRNQFVNEMLREVKARETCMHCKHSMEKVQVLRNKIILSKKRNVAKGSTEVLGKVKAFEAKYVTPDESRTYMRNIWKEEKELMREIIAVLGGVEGEHPTDVFYWDVIPVIPPNMRPVNIVNSRVSEHPTSQLYKNIIHNTILLRLIIQVVKNKGDLGSLPPEAKGAYNVSKGSSPIEKLNLAWESLQSEVDSLIDTTYIRNANVAGLKQIIEKKTGIIRMHMMGKRVNFSARTVITPDPNLNIDEIGIPEVFAKHLTYPVPVTSWNVEELRKMIMNGPDVHPGAVMVEYEDGTIKRINTNNTTQQESILKRLLTPDKIVGFRGVKRVHRHLCNGDVLLLNRQPTLHKPSIMAHTARVLKGEKTFRLHYANCKAYNADFDGDEMNAHFPQNELARSEAYNLVNVCNQYLVPKDGTPLSGLIQDHMIAGVKLSLRGRFFNEVDYKHFVFQALANKTGKIILLPPAIIKPCQLWSGKQILSTVFINIIPEGHERINLTASAKISAKAWQTAPPRKWKGGGSRFVNPNTMSEAEVVIRGGELLVGVLDKTHYGATPYGLVHCMYELYGGVYATGLLSALAKLFTRFLQKEGFTLGVHDILTVEKADQRRRQIIEGARKIGLDVITTALDMPRDSPIEEIVDKIRENSVKNPKWRATVDRQYKTALDSFTNDINKTCLPAGLVLKFPENNLQLMVQSGAKGTTVNTMQISCLLGQIELEGKRPPVMISGKSLPSFPIFEFAPRAGGFIDGRFMTGIQPQEFFFHCMAGREGLIDTAVKTSRSGYLQRCLIKHLEGLTVGYDLTVRDSDKCVIQFLYGEDGMDISKLQFLNSKQLVFLADNSKGMIDKKALKMLKDEHQKSVKAHKQQLADWCEKFGHPLQRERKSPFSLFSSVVRAKTKGTDFGTKEMTKLWKKADKDIKDSFRQQCIPCPDPVNSIYQPDHHFGSLNEKLEELMNTYQSTNKKQTKQFQNMLKLKAMRSLCAPGEPVGLLAAQSIGEPSTQMTLNTFHFAGRGEMNVTLGIPRLREILMMASKNIKTPSMEIPFLPVENLEEKAEDLRKMLTRVVVADVLEKVDVTVELNVEPVRQHRYTLRFQFLPRKYYKNDFYVGPKYILKHMTRKFFGEMFTAIRKLSKVTSNLVMMDEEKRQKASNDDEEETNDADANEDSSDEEPEDTEDAKTGNKFKQIHDDQEPEESEREDSGDEDTETAPPVDDKTNEAVVESYNFAQNYIYDTKKHHWCEITFGLPLEFKKLDLTAILRDVAAKSVLWETPNIKRAITYMKNDVLTLRTDGINILEMSKYHALLDLNRLNCNDIHKMAETYGIEAAMKIIVKEVQDVFNVYGIKVDPRHLSLIADYMTFNGTFEPLSRKGMESSASPLQQMTFESSLTFLRNATIGGKRDNLTNPSSCLMVGKPCVTGTGCFEVLHKM
ncbi:DNA-directed RNA polymerase I subunit RPA1-like Protein [Tribolium castaneum]|uniref:DNA-directed RNA polymerase subunit n=1 Tax=Tribolium castaneum TaxID=7070 RepID=D2A5Z9_TRICA|nr:PREDICTED: DNA-directed RNA polymerase I subunit RPA1 [Tribolium castaneum]EFA05003.1 DNA-directed RNA polymerase I subunit RPA1-like Protein [Tribolium castaneum]|eukprot:XP_970918.1 PREDICTED: DNA-directed RNA polymerase I subunit RPA1 [Tribolium castaneum]